MSEIWFKRKKYGWGWTPANLKGWLVIAVFLAVNLSLSYLTKFDYLTISPLVFFSIVFVSVAILLILCFRKGEPLAWQWGNKK